MSEIQSATNPEWIKYVFMVIAGLAGIINALIIYIFRNVKKDIDKIRHKQDKDHDRLNKVETKVDIYHPENSN